MVVDLPQLDVFHGDLTANRAVVYARLPRPVDDAGLTLAGHVRGPRCLHAETLPATSPLIDLGPGPTLLAQAIVPEPCFWSPDLPAIYDVTVNLKRGDEIVATVRREIGLRSLGAHGKQLLREGKPWTLRGVFETSTAAALPRAWHDAAAAYVSDQADEERLLEASQWGAIAAVGIGGRSEEIADHLRQLALHPAAALAIVNGDLPRDFKPPSVAPNILLAQRHKATDPLAVRPWANLLWAEVSEAEALSKLMPMAALPVVAVRRLASPLPIDQARAACDQLQRDLAPIGQFAGYIV